MRNLTGFSRKILRSICKVTLLTITIFTAITFANQKALTAQSAADPEITASSDIIYTIKEERLIISMDVTLSSDSSYPTIVNYYNIFLPFRNVDKALLSSGNQELQFSNFSREEFTEFVINLGGATIRDRSTYSFKALFEIPDFNNLTSETTTSRFDLPVALAEDLDIRSVQIVYPNELGTPLHSSIPYSKLDSIGDYFYLHYHDIERYRDGTNALTLIAGEQFSYLFDIDKTFVNDDHSEKFVATVNIPRQHHNQRLTFYDITPNPTNVYTDSSGNLFFQYNVNPQESVRVTVSGEVILTKTAENNPDSSTNSSVLTENTGYWKIDNAESLAELTDFIDRNGKTNIRNSINSYLFERIRMSESASNENKQFTNVRIGAEKALEQRNELSLEELVDTHIAVYRYFGIPSRMIFGQFVPHEYGSQGFFHYWLEVMDENGDWYIKDPALESMLREKSSSPYTFGNHIAILVRDQDSMYPTFTTTESANYGLVLANKPSAQVKNITASSEISSVKFWEKNAVINLKIKNNGNTIIRKISSNNDAIKLIKESEKFILPGQEISLSISVPVYLFNNDSYQIELGATGLDGETTISYTEVKISRVHSADLDMAIKLSSILIFTFLISILFNLEKVLPAVHKVFKRQNA